MAKVMHTCVSIAYLEEKLAQGKSANTGDSGVEWSPALQRWQIDRWKAQGYTYAPSCDTIGPDGHCAGHPIRRTE